jgi:P4 family phage/plasmid primase-like protien
VAEPYFARYAKTLLCDHILPIIPPGAKLKEGSAVSPGQLGKIPGKWFAHIDGGVWSGFYQWQAHRATAGDLERWDTWREVVGDFALGLNTRRYHALDIDIDNVELANRIEAFVVMHWGMPLAIRRRVGNDARRVLIYEYNQKTPMIRKLALRFRETGRGQEHLVELLATGQFVVIEGPHSSGAMHYWQDGKGLVEAWNAGQVSRYDDPACVARMLDGQKANELWKFLADWVDRTDGYELIKMSLPTASEQRDAIAINDPLSPYYEQDEKLLAKAVQAIDLDDERMDYETFILLLRAICAACGGDHDFLEKVVWPWVCTQTVTHGAGPRTEDQPGGGLEWLTARWTSFHASTVGADFIYSWAAQFGCVEAQRHLAESAIEEAFGDAAVDGPPTGEVDAEGAEGDGGEQQAAGGGGAPAFPWTDHALATSFAAANPDWRYVSGKRGWHRRDSGVFVPVETVLDPIGEHCSAVGEPYRHGSANDVKIDVMCKSQHKAEAVERKLRGKMGARYEDFDTDPWMINTPEFLWGLNDRNYIPHGWHQELNFLQTAVTPNLLAWGNYERYCPRFLEMLHDLVADSGNPQALALLQRHLSSNLIGLGLDQVLLFIYGQGGTAKSTLSDIMIRILGSYVTAGSTTLFQKSAGKRSFEVGDVAGKRGLFVPETLKGMTWDEVLVCELLGGVPIRAEQKFIKSFSFRSFASITATGNHLPQFITSSVPNKSGIDRRLLMLKVNTVIAEDKVDVEFARKLVDEEGPAILCWLLQGAYEGYQQLQATGKFLGPLADQAKADARAYKDTMSPHRAWMEDEGIVEDPNGTMNASEAWRSYKAWMHEDNPMHRESSREFRDNLYGMSNGRISYKRTMSRRVYIGMRYADPSQNEGVAAFADLTSET